MSRTPPWRRALPPPKDGKGNLRVYAKYDLNGLVVEAVFDYRDLPQGVVQKILQMVREAKPEVHILSCGAALCGLPGVPRDWPEGHQWVPFLDHQTRTGTATCDACIKVATKSLQNPIDKRT